MLFMGPVSICSFPNLEQAINLNLLRSEDLRGPYACFSYTKLVPGPLSLSLSLSLSLALFIYIYIYIYILAILIFHYALAGESFGEH